MASLWSELVDGASRGRDLIHPLPAPERMPLADILERAERTAAALPARVPDPRRVAILMSNGEKFVRAIAASFRLGAAIVPLPLPIAFGGLEAYLGHLRRIVERAEVGCVLLDETTTPLAQQLADGLPGVAILDVDDLRGDGDVHMVSDGAGSDLAVVQFTSGSTSAPKGVALTHDNVSAGIHPLTEEWGWREDDVTGVWIPLFHDMGLFATLSTLTRGADLWLWRSTDFVKRGTEWLSSLASSGVSVIPQPNFAFDYMIRTARTNIPPGLDLSRLRVAINGAETIHRYTVEAFAETFGPYGFAPEAMQPVYGLAEATLAVSFPEPSELPRIELIERGTLVQGQEVRRADVDGPEVRSVVSVGRPVEGIELRIGDADESVLGEGNVGEIQIRGPAVMGGYLGVPAASQPFTADGWLQTGDLGFQLDGELFIVGRVKDMMILHGQNYYPEDVEEIVRQVPNVTRRHCVAMGVEMDGRETMAVLFETKLEGEEAEAAADQIKQAIAAQLGLSSVEVMPVRPRTIPHTPSGKVQRRAARVLCEERAMDVVNRGWAAAEVS